MLIEIFLKTVNMSLGAVPLMLAVLILRAIFKKAVPRKVFYFAWILVFIRLMVPFSFESDLSFFGFLPESYVTEAPGGSSIEFITDRGETLDFPVLSHPSEDNPNVDAVMPEQYLEEETVPLTPPQQVTSPAVTRSPVEKNLVFATAWAFGTAALLVFGVIGYVAVLQKIKKESVSYANNILLCDFFTTPMVCGFVKPKIILPLTFDFDDESKTRSVLSHENTHIKRLDNLRRLLASFTLYVHWFNPLVWVCYWAFIRDMEVSCDEEVLQKSRSDIRGSYAESLVALAGAGTNPLYGGVLSFGETAIKERVKCIMNFKKAKLFIIIICVAVAAALGVIFLTNPAAPTMENSFERLYGSVYTGGDTAPWHINSTIKNIGTEPIYLSAEYGVYRIEGEKKVPAVDPDIPENGIVVIPAGETYCFTLTGRTNIFGDTSPYGDIEIIRKIYHDPECTRLLGEANWVYSVTPEFSGFIATDYYYITPFDYAASNEYGEEADLARFNEILSSLDITSTEEFIAVRPLNVGDIKITVTEGIAQEFIRLTKDIKPEVITPTEPDLQDTMALYFKTLDGEFYLYYDGRITLYEVGKTKGITLGVGNIDAIEEMKKSFENMILNPPETTEINYHFPFTGKIVYAENFEGDVMKIPSKTEYSFAANISHIEVKQYMSKITPDNISEIYVYRTPYEGRIAIDMGMENAAKILHYLSVMIPTYPEKTDKPFSDNGTHICVKSTEGLAYYVRLADDGYFTFYTPGVDKAVMFSGSDCRLAFDAINALVDGIMQENVMNPPAPLEPEEPVKGVGLYNPGDSSVLPLKYAVNNKRLGTEQDSKEAKLAVQKVTSQNIKSIYVSNGLDFDKKDIPISKTGAMAIVNALREIKFEVYDIPELPNPTATGGNIFYIETAEDTFYIDCTHGMITFLRKGDKDGIVFTVLNEHATLKKISDIVDEVTGQVTNSANGPVGFSEEGVRLPGFKEVESVTLFNNTERICTDPYYVNEGTGRSVFNIFLNQTLSGVTEFQEGNTTDKIGKTTATASGLDSLEFAQTDGKKYTVSFYEKGFTLWGSAAESGTRGMYLVDPVIWEEFLGKIEGIARESDFDCASWMGVVYRKRVTYIKAYSNEFSEEREYKASNEPGVIYTIISQLKAVKVKPNPIKDQDKGCTGLFVSFNIQFENGNQYWVYITKEKLKIVSDDMDYALTYTLAGEGEKYYGLFVDLANKNHELNVVTG